MPSSAHARHFRLTEACPAGTALVRLDATSRFHAASLYQEAEGQDVDQRYRPLAQLAQVPRTPLRPGSGQIGQARHDPVVTHEQNMEQT